MPRAISVRNREKCLVLIFRGEELWAGFAFAVIAAGVGGGCGRLGVLRVGVDAGGDAGNLSGGATAADGTVRTWPHLGQRTLNAVSRGFALSSAWH